METFTIRKNLTTERLVHIGTEVLKEYIVADARRTDVLRQLAQVVVTLRSKFRTKDNKTDWAGRSTDYQLTVTRMYTEAGVPPDSRAGVQAALRYHIGNALRETAPAKELRDLGLQAESPQQRAATSAGNGRDGRVIPAPIKEAVTAAIHIAVEQEESELAKFLRVALSTLKQAQQLAQGQTVEADIAPLLHEIQTTAAAFLKQVTAKPRGRPKSVQPVKQLAGANA